MPLTVGPMSRAHREPIGTVTLARIPDEQARQSYIWIGFYGKIHIVFSHGFFHPMNDLIRGRILVSSLALMLLDQPLRADGESTEVTKETELQEHIYVTATRKVARDLDVSAAVTAVDGEQLLEQGAAIVAEMLRGQPGTFFQQTTPGQGIPIIRGLKGSQVLHMVDGMRLNNTLFRNAPNQYLGLVDSFATQRLEVVRGAQGSLYGADAMGGVMHILTQEPELTGSSWQDQGQLYSSYDSVDNGWVVNARIQGGKQGWGFAGGASYQDHSSRTSGSGERLDPSGYRSKAADLKFVIAGSDNSSLMLSAQVMEQPSTPRYDELVPGFGQIEPSSSQFLFEPNRRSFIHARFRMEGKSGWFDRFEAHAARQVITDDRLTQAWQDPVIVTEENSSTLDGITLQFNSRLSTGTQLVWGAEYYTDAVDSRRFEQLAQTATVTEVRSRFPDNSSMDSMAVYLSGEWFPTQDLSITAGLRYSWFNISLPSGNGLEAVKLSPADLTGDLHLIYALNPNLKLVANFGRGFRPPNIFDLATLGPRPGNRFNVANQDLGPESVWSYDLGFKTETGALELEVFAFYLDYSDKITSVLSGEITADGRDIVRSVNRNKVDIYGLEAGMYWAFSNDISAFAVLNLTRGEETNNSTTADPADRIPPVNGRVGLSYQFSGHWHIEPYLLFAGGQSRLSPRDVRDPRIDPLGTPGWYTVNLLVDWQVTSALQLGLRLENIVDKAYREHASGIDAPGRNVGVWVNFSFL